MNKDKIPICEDRESVKVVQFIELDKLIPKMQNMHQNNMVWGTYYINDELVAEDIWGYIHTDILK